MGLQKLSFKLGQTQQLHTLELANIRSTHQFEQDQLKAQIRAFTGSLERESRKDAKIQELTEENEELKADKELTALNYEMVLSRLNTEADDNIKHEIDKRVKETAQLKREINDLKQQMKRSKDRKDRLEIEQNQLKEENERKDAIIQQMKLMYLKEKKRNKKCLHRAVTCANHPNPCRIVPLPSENWVRVILRLRWRKNRKLMPMAFWMMKCCNHWLM